MKGIPLQWNEGGGGIRPSPKSSWNIDLSAEVFFFKIALIFNKLARSSNVANLFAEVFKS